MEPLAGSGMFTSTHSNLVAEIGQELRGLECHIKELEGERDEVGRSKRSYEAEKRRAVAKIQKLRGKVASLNSQVLESKQVMQWIRMCKKLSSAELK